MKNENLYKDKYWYTGWQAFKADIWNYMPDEKIFDIMDRIYIPLINEKKLCAFILKNDSNFFDLGTIESFKASSFKMLNLLYENENNSINISNNITTNDKQFLELFHSMNDSFNVKDGVFCLEKPIITKTVKFNPPVWISRNCRIGENSIIGPNVILNDNSVIEENTILKNSIAFNINNRYIVI